MSKLLNFKEWVTLPEAVRHLGAAIKEEVVEADLLQFALDQHLVLSVNFVNPVWSCSGEVMPIDEAPPLARSIADILDRRAPVVLQGGDRVFVPDDEVVKLVGAFDLPMVGPEINWVHSCYHVQTDGPPSQAGQDGSFVASADGKLWQLLWHKTFLHQPHTIKLRDPWDHPRNFMRAGWFPHDAVLIIRTGALRDFQAKLAGRTADGRFNDPQNTLLKLVIGMAVGGYKYKTNGERSDAVRQIAEDLANPDLNIPVDEDTVRNWLKKAAVVLPGKAQ